MRTSLGLFRPLVAGAALLAGTLVILAAVPILHGQTVRERPLSNFTYKLLGGTGIGIEIRDVDEADRTREKLDALAGAVVDQVDRDSPAAEAGVRAGDVVTAFDGERVRSARQLSRLIEETPAGRTVAATVVRDGRTLTLNVTPREQSGLDPLGDIRRFYARPDAREFVVPPETRPFLVTPGIMPPGDLSDLLDRATSGRLGATVQPLTDQLAAYFGVSAGVLVTAVTPGTPAADAGLRAGDVITAIGDRPVRDGADATRALRQASGEVDLAIVRDRQAQHLTARIGGGR
ncbi:MAG: PDZ domain-containing protein [Vicinamibacterales bacterium]